MDGGAFSLPPAGASAAVPVARPERATWTSRGATVLLGLVVLLAIAVAVAAAAGIRSEVVLTGSMRPAISPGDMVVVSGISADQMRVGDIVSFHAPDNPGIVITHRVRSLHPARGSRIAVVTRGDANNTPERWTIARDGHVARVVEVIPWVGNLTNWTHDPSQRLIVFLVLGGVLLVFGLRWVWSDR